MWNWNVITANRQEVLDLCPFTQYEFIAKDQLQYWPVADTQKDGQSLWIVKWPEAIHHNFFLCYLFSVPTKHENYLYYLRINMEELEGNMIFLRNLWKRSHPPNSRPRIWCPWPEKWYIFYYNFDYVGVLNYYRGLARSWTVKLWNTCKNKRELFAIVRRSFQEPRLGIVTVLDLL